MRMIYFKLRFETLQKQTRFLCWQLPFNEHDVLPLQLHGEGFSCSFNIYISSMTVYHTFKVRQGTITNLDIIRFEQFMTLMRFWEMFTQQAEELFADICRNMKTKWWVKPYILSFSIFGVICYCGCILLSLKCNLMFKFTFGQCIVL